MQRFTISLDDTLAEAFDRMIAERGYENRSEAVRDLIRARLGDATLDARDAPQCVASVSYVYDHHQQPVTARLLDLQHDHHDLVVTSIHTHLDHDHCLENVVLRGPTAEVLACADTLVALRGVRHGRVHLIPMKMATRAHRHGKDGDQHTHHSPVS